MGVGQKGPGGYFQVSISCMLLLILIIPKASGIDHNNSAGPLRYEVSASAASMVADQPDHAPNKAETCAVLQRRYTGVRHALSAQNVKRHWLN